MKNDEKTVVALGMFDGVHIGHKKLIDTAVLIAKARGFIPAVYTFSNHPQELLGNKIARLCTNDDRCKYISNLGIERIEMVEFTSQIRASSPKGFVDELIELMKPAVVVAGFNYTFGMKKAGNADMLKQLALARGIDAAIVPPVLFGKQPISSTRIRSLIEKGDVQQAQMLLGRTHNLQCTIIDAFEFYGIPMMGLNINRTILLPASGVYICFAEIDGCLHPAIAYICGGNTKLFLELVEPIRSFGSEAIVLRFIKNIRIADFSMNNLSLEQLNSDRAKACAYFGI